MQRQYNEVNSRLNNLEVVEEAGLPQGMRTVAAGYVFGGWNFGPEGAMYDFYRQVFSQDLNPDNDSEAAIKDYVRQKYGLSRTGFEVPAYPDWDVADWARLNADLTEVGRFPNDYINTFFSQGGAYASTTTTDAGIVAGAASENVNPDGLNGGGNPPSRQVQFNNTTIPSQITREGTRVTFSYIKKRIEFVREDYPGMIDYKIDVNLVNSLPLVSGAKGPARIGRGQNNANQEAGQANSESARYIGNWVEKGEDYFIIYLAFATHDVAGEGDGGIFASVPQEPYVPAPHTYRRAGTNNTVTASERGGERFSSFIVPVDDILTSNPSPYSSGLFNGYEGNPRVGKCTYPTVTWSMNAVGQSDASFFYGNLNTNNVISLNQD